jgi:hypothetical protein
VEYSDINDPSYFEDFTIPKPRLGQHAFAAQCPFFLRTQFSALQKYLGHSFAFLREGVPSLHQGVSVVQVAIGITVGFFLAALIVYPVGKRRSGLLSF